MSTRRSARHKRASKDAVPHDAPQSSGNQCANHSTRNYDRIEYWERQYAAWLKQESTASQSTTPSTSQQSDVKSSKDNNAVTGQRKKRKSEQITVDDEKSAAHNGHDNDALVEADDEEDFDDRTTEWYYSLSHFLPLISLPKALRTQPVLDVGCGVSDLLQQLAQAGFTGKLIGVDASPSAIATMQLRQNSAPASASPNELALHYRVVNMFEFDADGLPLHANATEHADLFAQAESYAMIADKATSDGIMCSDAAADHASCMYAAIGRLLLPGGLFFLISVQDVDSSWLSELVIPSLQRGDASNSSTSGGQHRFSVDVHILEDTEYMDGEKQGPNIYIIKKSTRVSRKRRARTAHATRVSNEEIEDETDEIEITQHFH